MTAEAIGKVIKDFRRNSIDTSVAADQLREADPTADPKRLFGNQVVTVAVSTVVDVTALWQQIVDRNEDHALYDHRLLPPWPNASYCFVNGHGNVHVLNVVTVPADEHKSVRWQPGDYGLDDATHTIDWDEVAYVSTVTVWLGGRSDTAGPLRTTGPLHAWLWAIDANGVPLDIRWVHMRPDIEMDTWRNAELVVLGAVDFLNCRNVKIVEPKRPRIVQRRVDRTGITVHEITVTPIGTSTRTRRGPIAAGAVPLTSVRGHFAEYGIDGKGLLFGKLSGRYWIPQHARGSADHGVSEQTFNIKATP